MAGLNAVWDAMVQGRLRKGKGNKSHSRGRKVLTARRHTSKELSVQRWCDRSPSFIAGVFVLTNTDRAGRVHSMRERIFCFFSELDPTLLCSVLVVSTGSRLQDYGPCRAPTIPTTFLQSRSPSQALNTGLLNHSLQVEP